MLKVVLTQLVYDRLVYEQAQKVSVRTLTKKLIKKKQPSEINVIKLR